MRGPSVQLSSLLTIHGQHGNTEYKGGQKQESEQCLTTTARNSADTTLDMCKEKKNTGLTRSNWRKRISSSDSNLMMTSGQ